MACGLPSQPAGSSCDVNDLEAAVRRRARRNALHDLAGAIGRAIIHGDHFVVVVVERQQAS